jgi:hypothetical protein
LAILRISRQGPGVKAVSERYRTHFIFFDLLGKGMSVSRSLDSRIAKVSGLKIR